MNLSLPLDLVGKGNVQNVTRATTRRSAIEDDGFPFEKFCEVAELESWRKEVNRPLYHVHKWWAQRLGSVFRAMILGALAPEGADIGDSFYKPVRYPKAVVFDPFMGSGTTIGEALKLGCRAIGRDINPVAFFAVKNALALHSREQVLEEFRAIERDVAPQIQRFYEARLPEGGKAQSLYYFWVKSIDCPACETGVDLFGSYVFARHAYPKRFPTVRAVCPNCGDVNRTRYDANRVMCGSCRQSYDPKAGPARGGNAVCPQCEATFPIAKTVRESGSPPKHRLYAKLVLTASGEKRYLPADDFDHALYQKAVAALNKQGPRVPKGKLKSGYNTNQAINYCYRRWHEMFNDRQLLCLRILADRIRSIERPETRDLFACLFSGTLEFNNMFASYKGEGTGAVRHMFSHHVLKPERTPLEANPWGTPKSSGAFSTLFKSRILRTIDYCEDPFEIMAYSRRGKAAAKKIFGLSEPIGFPITNSFESFEKGQERLYLSCGDSSRTDLAPGSVDAVITDPPFFDNVHYSELADFFHVWQQYILEPSGKRSLTTRSDREVQQTDAAVFTERLRGVWQECRRVLRPEGLLVFTYHHSKPEGWHSVLDALTCTGFAIVAAHPIKAEMSVAMPKNQAKEPIDLDIIMVCRRRENTRVGALTYNDAWNCGVDVARDQISRLRRVGRQLSRNDIRVVLMAQIIRFLSVSSNPGAAHTFLEGSDGRINEVIDSLGVSQRS